MIHMVLCYSTLFVLIYSGTLGLLPVCSSACICTCIPTTYHDEGCDMAVAELASLYQKHHYLKKVFLSLSDSSLTHTCFAAGE